MSHIHDGNTLGRIASVIEAVAAHPEPRTLTQIHEATHIPKRTIIRYINALEASRIIERANAKRTHQLYRRGELLR